MRCWTWPDSCGLRESVQFLDVRPRPAGPASLVMGIKDCDANWKVKYVNKLLYTLKLLTTNNIINHDFYNFLLSRFRQDFCNTSAVGLSLRDDIIIDFDDGTRINIDGNGIVTWVFTGGCGDNTKGNATKIWGSNGQVIWEAGQNNTTTGKWDPNEDSGFYFNWSDIGNSGGGPNGGEPMQSNFDFMKSKLNHEDLLRMNSMAECITNHHNLHIPAISFWNNMSQSSVEALILANFSTWNRSMTYNDINDVYIFTNAYEELIFLKNIGYTLDTPDNTTTKSYIWLRNNQPQFNALKDHFYSNSTMPFIKDFCVFMTDYHPDINFLQENIDSYLEDMSPQIPVNNGITINYTIANLPNTDPTYPLLGNTKYRHPHNPPTVIAPDMKHGTDGGGISFLNPFWDTHYSTNATLWANYSTLLNVASSGNYILNGVANDFKQRFQNNTGDDYYHQDLSFVLKDSGPMYNAIKNIGNTISAYLSDKAGDYSQMYFPDILPVNNRPVFSGDWVSGSTILLNDVEKVEVYLEEINVNTTTGHWTATLYLKVIDHFGLDKSDLTGRNTWRQGIVGFTAWWRLQYQRDFKPFRTILRVKANISGDYN